MNQKTCPVCYKNTKSEFECGHSICQTCARKMKESRCSICREIVNVASERNPIQKSLFSILSLPKSCWGCIHTEHMHKCISPYCRQQWNNFLESYEQEQQDQDYYDYQRELDMDHAEEENRWLRKQEYS